jgi:hypothetical protein
MSPKPSSFPSTRWGLQAQDLRGNGEFNIPTNIAYLAVSVIDIKTVCALIMDTEGNLHTITTHITWYTSSTLRENATARLLNIFEKSTQGAFNTNDIPL